jgi:hypothetical protein
MNIPSVANALFVLYPDKKCRIPDTENVFKFSDIIWEGSPPTVDESAVTELANTFRAEYDANQYQRDRAYPDLGEQLDMLFHDMTAGKGTKDGEWYKAVAKVKSDNPKE